MQGVCFATLVCAQGGLLVGGGSCQLNYTASCPAGKALGGGVCVGNATLPLACPCGTYVFWGTVCTCRACPTGTLSPTCLVETPSTCSMGGANYGAMVRGARTRTQSLSLAPPRFAVAPPSPLRPAHE